MRKKWREYSDEYLGKVFRWHIENILYVDVNDSYEDIEDLIETYEARN